MKACTEITAPVAGLVNDLEKEILNLFAKNEDTFRRLAVMEAFLDKEIQKPAEVVQGIVSLRSDVNQIHELNPTTAQALDTIEQTLTIR